MTVLKARCREHLETHARHLAKKSQQRTSPGNYKGKILRMLNRIVVNAPASNIEIGFWPNGCHAALKQISLDTLPNGFLIKKKERRIYVRMEKNLAVKMQWKLIIYWDKSLFIIYYYRI